MKDRAPDAAVDGRFFSRLKATSRFVLVRHGESEGNAAGIFQGRKDFPLSPNGRSQAERLGGSLARFGDVAVLCSPLSRARETAEIAAAAAGFAAPKTCAVLTELETGDFTGRSWNDIRENEAEAWHSFRTRSWEGVKGAEREAELYSRAVDAWTLLRSEAERRADAAPDRHACVVAVTHGGFLQWLIRATFGARSWFPVLPIENCSAYIMRSEPTGPESAALFWEEMHDRIDS